MRTEVMMKKLLLSLFFLTQALIVLNNYASLSNVTNSTYKLNPNEQQKLDALKQALTNKDLKNIASLIKDIRVNIIEKYIQEFDSYKEDLINPVSITANIAATKTNYLEAIYVIHSQIRALVHEPYWLWRKDLDGLADDFVPMLNKPDFSFDKLLVILRKNKMDEILNIYTKIVLPLKEIETDLTLVLTNFISAYFQNLYYQKVGLDSANTPSSLKSTTGLEKK